MNGNDLGFHDEKSLDPMRRKRKENALGRACCGLVDTKRSPEGAPCDRADKEG
jgi:hypothetical protein